MAGGERLRKVLLREAVERGQGGHLVALGESRIVEDAIDKIVELAAMGHNRLADVHQFRRALADDVHAQKLPRLAVKEQL